MTSIGGALLANNSSHSLEFEFPFQIGTSSDGGIYLYTGMGQALGFLILEANAWKSDFWSMAGFVCMVVPESVTYYFLNGSKSRLGVYASPWGFEYRNKRPSIIDEIRVSAESGLRYNSEGSKVKIHAFLGTKVQYGSGGMSITAGAGILF